MPAPQLVKRFLPSVPSMSARITAISSSPSPASTSWRNAVQVILYAACKSSTETTIAATGSRYIHSGCSREANTAAATGTELNASDRWCQAFAITADERTWAPTRTVIRYSASFARIDSDAIAKAGQLGCVTVPA